MKARGYLLKPVDEKKLKDLLDDVSQSYLEEPKHLIVKTEFGYHVILVEDVRASKPLSLKDVEPQLKNMVTQQVVAQIFEDLVKNAKVEKFTLEGEPITDKK